LGYVEMSGWAPAHVLSEPDQSSRRGWRRKAEVKGTRYVRRGVALAAGIAR